MSASPEPEGDRTFLQRWGIWLAAFGYFAAYVPYSAMTKMATDGLFSGMNGRKDGISSFEMQAVTIFGSVLTAYLFISLVGWWKFATKGTLFGVQIRRPQWFTLVSGLCASIQIITTTLAYTFHGVSIAFVMLFLRGGVLIIAPIVDLINGKRKVHFTSWIASVLALAALVWASKDAMSRGSKSLPFLLILNIAAYLTVYFFRLIFMSDKAKSSDPADNKRFFVEEQMVAAPALLVMLFLVGIIANAVSPASPLGGIWRGFTDTPSSGYALHLILIGVLSTGTGIFGTLIFLDKRENTFTVPINRASSILAGVTATYFLHVQYNQKPLTTADLAGAALLIGAIFVLMLRSVFESRARKAAQLAKS